MLRAADADFLNVNYWFPSFTLLHTARGFSITSIHLVLIFLPKISRFNVNKLTVRSVKVFSPIDRANMLPEAQKNPLFTVKYIKVKNLQTRSYSYMIPPLLGQVKKRVGVELKQNKTKHTKQNKNIWILSKK